MIKIRLFYYDTKADKGRNTIIHLNGAINCHGFSDGELYEYVKGKYEIDFPDREVCGFIIEAR